MDGHSWPEHDPYDGDQTDPQLGDADTADVFGVGAHGPAGFGAEPDLPPAPDHLDPTEPAAGFDAGLDPEFDPGFDPGGGHGGDDGGYLGDRLPADGGEGGWSGYDAEHDQPPGAGDDALGAGHPTPIGYGQLSGDAHTDTDVPAGPHHPDVPHDPGDPADAPAHDPAPHGTEADPIGAADHDAHLPAGPDEADGRAPDWTHPDDTVGADPDAGWQDGADLTQDPPFPPALDLDCPEPVDGPPWIDPGHLGDGAVLPDLTTGAQLPAGGGAQLLDELFAHLGEAPPAGANGWAALVGSADPATSALARWWAPGG